MFQTKNLTHNHVVFNVLCKYVCNVSLLFQSISLVNKSRTDTSALLSWYYNILSWFKTIIYTVNHIDTHVRGIKYFEVIHKVHVLHIKFPTGLHLCLIRGGKPNNIAIKNIILYFTIFQTKQDTSTINVFGTYFIHQRAVTSLCLKCKISLSEHILSQSPNNLTSWILLVEKQWIWPICFYVVVISLNIQILKLCWPKQS